MVKVSLNCVNLFQDKTFNFIVAIALATCSESECEHCHVAIISGLFFLFHLTRHIHGCFSVLITPNQKKEYDLPMISI
jgi:hypothetical protein